jgi:hypothetical protein
MTAKRRTAAPTECRKRSCRWFNRRFAEHCAAPELSDMVAAKCRYCKPREARENRHKTVTMAPRRNAGLRRKVNQNKRLSP